MIDLTNPSEIFQFDKGGGDVGGDVSCESYDMSIPASHNYDSSIYPQSGYDVSASMRSRLEFSYAQWELRLLIQCDQME